MMFYYRPIGALFSSVNILLWNKYIVVFHDVLV